MPAHHHRLIVSELEQVAKGNIKRLMILAPPGSAKTTYASSLFPSWFFAFRSRSSIIAVSHTQELAETNSAFVQRIIRDHAETLGYRLSKRRQEPMVHRQQLRLSRGWCWQRHSWLQSQYRAH